MPVVFTERELDVIAVLWERGPSTVAEVRASLTDALSHNTVATMLTILEHKGYVSHTEEGRAFRYHPLVDREEAGQSAFGRLVETVFGGSAEALVTHFVRDRRLTKDELKRIRALLDERIESESAPAPASRRRKS
ncbi:MAG TPA: BlaI/MecI/CopY family transcriptional regulator [Gemmatimonadaceae bacterium]|nr:BlaI/MecI/CopY family transcriptional regulator [Gemmatimonadaceae bacterium]